MMGAYYNEHDPKKCAWLRELISRGVIANGEVDERSIADVRLDDLRGFTQCHFFAGIGVWSYALRLAGWPDDRPVWTGSCPCPSFSAAGKGEGFDDPRHLWPDWARLIRVGKPATVFGEQADDAIGYGWLDLVQTDLERENYAVGKAVLGACSVGAPHIRQRVFFVGSLEHAACERQPFWDGKPSGEFQRETLPAELRSSDARRMGESNGTGSQPRESSAEGNGHGDPTIATSATGDVDHTQCDGWQQVTEDFCGRQSLISGTSEYVSVGDTRSAGLSQREHEPGISQQAFFSPARESVESGSYVNGFWKNADWILRKRWNRDDWEWCPTEPGTFPLASGIPCRVLRLRGYGDAIVPQVAAAFIQAFTETAKDPSV